MLEMEYSTKFQKKMHTSKFSVGNFWTDYCKVITGRKMSYNLSLYYVINATRRKSV